MQNDTLGEPATMTAPDAKQIIADAIRLRVVTASKLGLDGRPRTPFPVANSPRTEPLDTRAR